VDGWVAGREGGREEGREGRRMDSPLLSSNKGFLTFLSQGKKGGREGGREGGQALCRRWDVEAFKRVALGGREGGREGGRVGGREGGKEKGKGNA
jgi:hypothetical protein